ncbi:MAG: helix-turn-helix domain-containing protein [Fimbriimonadaceae bacterium]
MPDAGPNVKSQSANLSDYAARSHGRLTTCVDAGAMVLLIYGHTEQNPNTNGHWRWEASVFVRLEQLGDGGDMKNLIGPNRPRSHNRVAAIASHTTRYAFKRRSRLAADAGISRSALSRLMAGRTRPTHALLSRVAQALERELGRQFDCRELVSETGHYPTKYVCELVGCPGCIPVLVDHHDPLVRARYAGVQPGLWTGDNLEAFSEDWQAIPEEGE